MSEPKTTILYADDDENDVFFMKRAFAKAWSSGKLIVVPDGLRAVNYIFGRDEFADRTAYPLPGLIMLDLKMPHLTGLEALAEIRTNVSAIGIPAILLTSSNHETDIAAAQALRASGYFVKPSNATELAELLKSLAEAYHANLGRAPTRFDVKGNRLPL